MNSGNWWVCRHLHTRNRNKAGYLRPIQIAESSSNYTRSWEKVTKCGCLRQGASFSLRDIRPRIEWRSDLSDRHERPARNPDFLTLTISSAKSPHSSFENQILHSNFPGRSRTDRISLRPSSGSHRNNSACGKGIDHRRHRNPNHRGNLRWKAGAARAKAGTAKFPSQEHAHSTCPCD